MLSGRFDRPHSEKLKRKNRGYGGPASCASGGLPRSFLAPQPATIVYPLGGIYDAKDTEVTQVRPHLHEVSPLLVGSTHLVALVGSPLLVGDATTLTDTCMLISIDVCVCMGRNVCSLYGSGCNMNGPRLDLSSRVC